ncbi:MAG: hypothetical protein MJZ47_06200, partial [Bacteroidales bacterium]|nr:hypothetical protein [Bacteroidales bacterium]
MKKITPLLIMAVAMLLFGCANENLSDEIAKLEKQAFSTEGAVEPQTAEQLVDAYCAFATQNPENQASAEYLFKAVNVSMNFDNPQKTIGIIDRMLTEYPDYQKTPTTLFLKGFIYETRFSNYEQARAAYEKYLELYPDGEFAADCRASIQNLGLSPEELVRMFEKP